MKILKLTLKKEWFDMILSGEKDEEYREIKPYWVTRLTRFSKKENHTIDEASENLKKPANVFLNNWGSDKEPLRPMYCFPKDYSFVKFTNGYNKKSPQVTKRIMGIEIGIGRKEFGAPDYNVFKIILGNEVSRQNC